MTPRSEDAGNGNRLAQRVGIGLVALLWLAVLAVGAVVSYEYIWPQLSSKSPQGPSEKEAFLAANHYQSRRLENPYGAFRIQHLHPIYLFYFPLSADKRRAISNEVVSIDAHGFRGSGLPAEKPLAFVLGGSAAFGDKASSDQSTISGYLNKIQASLHFVNAGVPSWNSTQELHRLADQIVPLKPRLVISYGLSNDIVVALDYAKKRVPYPPGAPESFDSLTKLVDDLRASSSTGSPRDLLGEMFPRTSRLAAKVLGRRRDEALPAATREQLLGVIEAAADKFVWNQTVMRAIAEGRQFRFVTVIQPMLRAHKHVAPSDRGDDRDWWLFEHAVRRVMATEYCQKNCLDYSNLFDAEFREIPVLRTRETRDPKDLIFADWVHLLDPGNERVAKRLMRDLLP